ncbi:MAG: 2-oxo acid dehydrogenase subunit E2 [Deltaproteobacteria bacterium]|nr:2-oxo acid dehydrogenase subunit E2 [Deltaproteobacteria bacterium]MBW2421350.1 2-oxo acid dehydrogenase subunit E2 [Deltaproteobacteria bacterium]
MAIEIRMPEVAADMTEADLVTWLVKPGDRVAEGELIAEIETDKSTVEFESPAAGIVAEILIPAGTAGVRVGEVLAILSEGNEPRPSPGAPAPEPEPSEPVHSEPVRSELALSEKAEAPGGGAIEAVETPRAAPQADASPTPATALARRLASQGGVDLATIEGTGVGGRVVKADVEAKLAGAPATPQAKAPDREAIPAEPQAKAPDREAVPAEPQAKAQDREAILADEAFRELPHSRMRRTIARRLSDAKRTIPHFYLRSECRIDALLELRTELNEAAAHEQRLSVNDFVVRACALALQEVPEANASWGEDALICYERSDIAIAVATEGGLVTPVVRSADRKGLAVLSREIRDLAERARTGKLLPPEYQGGTFSVSNLGMYGVDGVYAIVNPPQSCILGVGAGEARPAVVDGELAVATMMTCTLSADHRVVDGAVGARLLSEIKRRIENPLGMVL